MFEPAPEMRARIDSEQVQAVKRFKQLLFRRRPERLEGILGSASRIVQPPLSMRPSALRKSKSQDTDNRRPVEGVLAAEGVHRDIDNHERKCPKAVQMLLLIMSQAFAKKHLLHNRQSARLSPEQTLPTH